jgi:hypothetical protein
MKNYEVVSNNDKVWVNAPICVARFCRSSHEVIADGKDAGKIDAQMQLTVHESGTPTILDWNAFVKDVQARLGIHIAPRRRPSYIRGKRA